LLQDAAAESIATANNAARYCNKISYHSVLIVYTPWH